MKRLALLAVALLVIAAVASSEPAPEVIPVENSIGPWRSVGMSAEATTATTGVAYRLTQRDRLKIRRSLVELDKKFAQIEGFLGGRGAARFAGEQLP